MKKILLVEDDKFVQKIVTSDLLSSIENIEILSAETFTEANNIVRHNKDDVFIAIVDLELPDCKIGQAVSLTLAHKIPTIVLTGNEDIALKESLIKKEILEYVRKSSSGSLKYVVDYVKKIIRNANSVALVVDDSALSRDVLKTDLERLHLKVLEAKDGEEALSIMEESEERISLVLTDYNMPKIDGIELTTKLRESCEKDMLSIIALSASNNENALSEFIRAGANDFLAKPHRFEELTVRVNSNLDILDLFQKTKDLSNKDFLTGSYNRRYFFESAEVIVKKNSRKSQSIAVATLDIDKFKDVNDTYGHDIGDVAIQEIAKILKKVLRVTDLVARFGGEEYCILLEDISLEDTKVLFEKIRLSFEQNTIELDEIYLKYTVSLGVSYGNSADIKEMIKVSDEALYEAKDTGRNKVVVHEV